MACGYPVIEDVCGSGRDSVMRICPWVGPRLKPASSTVPQHNPLRFQEPGQAKGQTRPKPACKVMLLLTASPTIRPPTQAHITSWTGGGWHEPARSNPFPSRWRPSGGGFGEECPQITSHKSWTFLDHLIVFAAAMLHRPMAGYLGVVSCVTHHQPLEARVRPQLAPIMSSPLNQPCSRLAQHSVKVWPACIDSVGGRPKSKPR